MSKQKTQYKNIFQKNPGVGLDLLNSLLRNEITPNDAARIFNENGINAKVRNIQKLMSNIRNNNIPQSTPNIKPVQPRTKALTKSNADQQITTIRREYESFDFSKIPDIDVIKLLDKHIYDLENVLLDYQNDVVVQKNIIELEMKIADKLHKMRPSSTEFNINDVLRKNDYSTEFIVHMDLKHPSINIKKEWLKFLSEKDR